MKNMKKVFGRNSFISLAFVIVAASLALVFTANAAGPAPVNLLSAGNFVILAETGITNTGSHTTVITGNIGNSPGTAAQMNDVWCSEITGTIYGVDAAYTGSGATTCFAGNPPLSNKTLVDNAVLDMVTAYNTTAAMPGPDGTELFGGNLGGQTLAPGLYKWSTNVTIPTNVTLSGDADDVWIFQIAGDLSIASGGSPSGGADVVLIGGAQASNVFWQVGGPTGATLGTYSTFNGTILSAKQVILQTGAVLNGRALAQTQVVLDANTVSASAAIPPTECDAEQVTQTILSDTSNMIGGGNAVAIVPHPAWTAAISGSTTWIWQASSTVPNATVAFEKTFVVTGTVLSAQLDIASDNSYKVFIDGFQVAADANATNFTLATQDVYNLTANVTPGTHTLRIEVNNLGTFNASSNPAGLLYKFVVTTCPSPQPPTGDVTVTIVKNISGVHATAVNANSASFPMVSSWDAVNLGGVGNGTYPLSTVGFNTANPYEAVTSNMTNGSDYTTNEDTSTSVVGLSCTNGQQFRLVGYTTGSSLALAQAGTPTTTIPAFTNITTDKFVIVWNEPCPTGPQPPPANACSLASVPGYTLQTGTSASEVVTLAPNTMFRGNGGIDKVTGGDGNYIICTGTGSDVINLGNGDSTIDAGSGNNSVTVGNGTGFITTGSGSDNITTGDGEHTINAGSGSNIIKTGNGDQTVTTGSGSDQITTGDGDDVISAGGGNNTVKSGAGDDTVTAGSGSDNIDGGPDTDSCSAGGGINTVINCTP